MALCSSPFRAMGEEVLGGLDGPLVSPAQLWVHWAFRGVLRLKRFVVVISDV